MNPLNNTDLPRPSSESAQSSPEAPGKVLATIPSLDGIRALAVALVFFSHGGLGVAVPGGLGVTIFFVLSGYLITTLMRREYRATGAIRLPAFYLRRVLRLMPPLLIVVVVAGLLSQAGVIDDGFTLRGLLSVLFYFGNYHVIATEFQGVPAGLGVVWSLAVEEHYYLLFPPLAIWLLRGRRSRAIAVLAALCAAILGWRCYLALQGVSASYIEMATDTRADAILTGCLLAFCRNPALDPVGPANARRDWAIGGASVALLLATLIYRDELFRLTARYTLQCLAIAPLIYLAVARAAHAPFRWLNTRPLVYLGTISYTIYLSHQLILLFVIRHWPQLGWPGILALTAVLTLAVAEPMRRWVEQPFARLRKQLHRSDASAVISGADRTSSVAAAR